MSILDMRLQGRASAANRCLRLLAMAIALSSSVCPGMAQPAKEDAKDIIVTQIRKQGYDCAKPLSVARDAKQSKADSAVWVIECDNATYRVRLIPDMAARVERIK